MPQPSGDATKDLGECRPEHAAISERSAPFEVLRHHCRHRLLVDVRYRKSCDYTGGSYSELCVECPHCEGGVSVEDHSSRAGDQNELVSEFLRGAPHLERQHARARPEVGRRAPRRLRTMEGGHRRLTQGTTERRCSFHVRASGADTAEPGPRHPGRPSLATTPGGP